MPTGEVDKSEGRQKRKKVVEWDEGRVKVENGSLKGQECTARDVGLQGTKWAK